MSLIPRPILVRSAVALLLLPLFGLAGAPVAAQAPAADAQAVPDIAEELARLNRTLTRIAELMERQAEGQRLDLSLRRLAVESDRVESLEKELQSAEATRTSLEDQELSIRGRLTMFASELERMPADTPVEQLQDIERMTESTQRMLARLQSQRDVQERRILEIENELTRRRADLQGLQDRLDRQIDGM